MPDNIIGIVSGDSTIIERYQSETLGKPSSKGEKPSILEEIQDKYLGHGANSEKISKGVKKAQVVYKADDGKLLTIDAEHVRAGRIGGKRRYLHTSCKINGEPYICILEDLRDHKYEKSKFAQPEFNLQDYFDNEKVKNNILAQWKEIQEQNARAKAKRPLMLGRKVVLMSSKQKEAAGMQAPCICYGGGGTGKTFVTFDYLIEQAALGMKPIWCTQNLRLVQEMKTRFEQYCTLSYEDVLLEEGLKAGAPLPVCRYAPLLEKEQGKTYENIILEQEQLKPESKRRKLVDVSVIKGWIKENLHSQFTATGESLDVEQVLEEFTWLANYDEQQYIAGLCTHFEDDAQKTLREQLLQSYKNLQAYLAHQQLMYAPFEAVPVGQYADLIAKERTEAFIKMHRLDEVKFCTYDDLILEEDALKPANQQRTLVREKTIIREILPTVLKNKNIDLIIDAVLAEFEIMSKGDKAAYLASTKSKYSNKERAALFDIYKEYQHDFRDANYLKAWLKRHLEQQYPKEFLDIELVWQEFRILCGYRDDYYLSSDFGPRLSYFGGQEKQPQRQKLLAAFKSLEQFMSDDKLMYGPFTDLPSQKYLSLIVDESQDFSLRQLRSFFTACAKYNVRLCYDRLQILIDKMINKDEYIKAFFDKEIAPHLIIVVDGITKTATISECYLKENFRNKKAVCGLLNQAIRIRNVIAKERAEDDVVCQMEEEGTRQFLQDNEKSVQDITKLMTSMDAAIITLPEFVEEAKNKYKTVSVFTVDDIKGLERKHVVKYKYFSNKSNQKDLLHKINDELASIDLKSVQVTKHNSKDKEAKNEPYLHNVVTGVGRAIDDIIVVEDFADDHHKLNHVHHALWEKNCNYSEARKAGIVTDVVNWAKMDFTEIENETAEACLTQADTYIANQNLAQAEYMYGVHLKKLDPEKTWTVGEITNKFNEYLASTSEKNKKQNNHNNGNDNDLKNENTEESQATEQNQDKKKNRRGQRRRMQKNAAAALATRDQNTQTTPSSSSSSETVIDSKKNQPAQKPKIQQTKSQDVKQKTNEMIDLLNQFTATELKKLFEKLPAEKSLAYFFDHEFIYQRKKQNLFKHICEKHGKWDIFIKFLLEKNADKKQNALVFLENLDNQPNHIHDHLMEFMVRMHISVKDDHHFFRYMWKQYLSNAKRIHYDLVEYYLKCKDDVSVFHIPIRKGLIEVIKLMTKTFNLNVNDKDFLGRTALHIAVEAGQLEVIKYLLDECHADIDSQTNENHSPLSIAVLKGHKHVIDYFINTYDMDINFKTILGETPLHAAVRNRTNAIDIEYLINKGADINAKDLGDRTPLHIAARYGNQQLSQMLIEKGKAKINAKNKNGLTPLHLAIKYEHLMVIEYLIKAGADINAKTNDGSTPLHMAIQTGCRKTVNFLINKGADKTAKDDNGQTILHYAVLSGSVEFFTFVIKGNKHLINLQTKNGCTLLHIAIQNRSQELVKFLIEEGADQNIKDKIGQTPLNYAKKYGKPDIINLLLYGHTNTWDFNTLQAAAIEGDLGKFKNKESKSWYKDCILKTITKDKLTLLHIAATEGRLNIVEYLINRYPVDINAKDINNETPLHLAAANGRQKVIEFLVNKTADTNALNMDNATPLHLAAVNGHRDVIEFLIGKSTDINAKDINHDTPLHLAAQYGRQKAIECLIDRGADINAINIDNATPLHLAMRCLKRFFGNLNDQTMREVLKYKKQIIMKFIENGADIHAQNKNGETPLDIAFSEEYLDIVQYLVKYQTSISSIKQIKVSTFGGNFLNEMNADTRTTMTIDDDNGREVIVNLTY
jgi:ankyrin repeat protein